MYKVDLMTDRVSSAVLCAGQRRIAKPKLSYAYNLPPFATCTAWLYVSAYAVEKYKTGRVLRSAQCMQIHEFHIAQYIVYSFDTLSLPNTPALPLTHTRQLQAEVFIHAWAFA